MAMKSTVAAIALVGSGEAVAVARHDGSFLARTTRFLFGGKGDGLTHYGDTLCPCIGFDRISGETVVIFEEDNATNASVADGALPSGFAPAPAAMAQLAHRGRAKDQQVSYPADLGAHCEAWDQSRHPKCKGGFDDPDWCESPWCYVDPCKCNLPVLPKVSEYVPDARYRGAPIFFSYATCGGKNTYSEEVSEVGNHKCRCIGLDNVPGTIKVKMLGSGMESEVVSYPGDLGSTCENWDKDTHPECKGDKAPLWCFQRWCYVDPCECSIGTFPKVTMYLPQAAYQGKSLYYSYETCGSKDFFTKDYNTKACVNQDTKEKCLEQKLKSGSHKCAWTGVACLGWEIVEHPLCKKTAAKFGEKDSKEDEEEKTRSAAISGRSSSVWLLLAALPSLLAAASR